MSTETISKRVRLKNGKVINRKYIRPGKAGVRLRRDELGVVECNVQTTWEGMTQNKRIFVFRDGCKIEVKNPLVHV